MTWPTMGDMPLEVALAFEYLVRVYGRGSLNPVADQHEASLAASKPEGT